MWKIREDTPKRLPTWLGGKPLSPYLKKTSNTTSLSNYKADVTYLSSLSFNQKNKIPFLTGFSFFELGENGYNNSGYRGATVDLNSCYFLSDNQYVNSKFCVIDFYFSDLNSYRDLQWVNYYPEALIFKDKDTNIYKPTDLKGLSISDRTGIKIRLSFDVFLPFLGFSPLIIKKKLLKLSSVSANTENILYYDKIYRFDYLAHFNKNSFINLNGNVYLCP